jgi:SAM-dependent methyltransferase
MKDDDHMGARHVPESGDDLGLDRKPGDRHYRAFVGPPGDYDLVAAMSFNLLTVLGLRQSHAFLDIGCGSLRVGRLLIPYLNRGRYVGMEPERWLVEEGIEREIGRDLVRIKQPRFLFTADPAEIPPADDRGNAFDFALAQSVFSHSGLDLVRGWLAALRRRLRPTGALLATYLPGDADFAGSGWVYPSCVSYRPVTLADEARRAGFDWIPLDWAHPRQSWALWAGPAFDSRWIGDAPPSWNESLRSGPWAR